MTARRPVKLDGVLSVGSGNLGNLSDTRLKAGAAGSDATNFDTTGELADVSTVTVNYNKVIQTVVSVASLESTDDDFSFPLYVDGNNNLRPMSLADVNDTFVAPAVLLMCTTSTGTDQAGTYTITATTSAASGETNVSTTPVFTDTRANAAAYTAAGMPETVDQPTTITTYYLQRRNEARTFPTAACLFADSDGNINQGPLAADDSTFNAALAVDIKFRAAEDDAGHKLSYNINGSGNTRGSAIVDTRLNGDGAYTTNLVDSNDYRSQEFPNGAAVVIGTNTLKIVHV